METNTLKPLTEAEVLQSEVKTKQAVISELIQQNHAVQFERNQLIVDRQRRDERIEELEKRLRKAERSEAYARRCENVAHRLVDNAADLVRLVLAEVLAGRCENIVLQGLVPRLEAFLAPTTPIPACAVLAAMQEAAASNEQFQTLMKELGFGTLAEAVIALQERQNP